MTEMTNLEFNSICRLCIQIFEKEKMFPIFSNENYTISIPEKIKHCSSIEIHENDGLPPHICNTCLLKLNESFVFRNQCVLADITLKRLKDFSFNLNEIPKLSKVDIENQIIQSGNDDLLQAVYSSATMENRIKLENFNVIKQENFNEFDINRQSSHKRNTHKLKTTPPQKPQQDGPNHFDVSGNIDDSVFTPTVILDGNEREKVNKKQLKRKVIGGDESGTKTKRDKKSKRVKQFLKTKDSKKDGFCLNEIYKFEKNENDSLDLNGEGITENNGKKVVGSKTVVGKKGRRKKMSFVKEKPPSFQCSYCQKVYPSEGGWRYHVHTMHNENYQPFICDLCGESFKVKKNLEAHKNSIHFHLKHHLCDLCGRGFASKYSLKVHKSWHDDEKNFTCDICGTKFRTRGKMNTHRSIHGGPKNFMCHICSRDFRWKKDFEIHMRTHTGEKPFKCSHCGKAFASLTNMKKHEKNHVKKLERDKLELISSEDGKLDRNEILDFG